MLICAANQFAYLNYTWSTSIAAYKNYMVSKAFT